MFSETLSLNQVWNPQLLIYCCLSVDCFFSSKPRSSKKHFAPHSYDWLTVWKPPKSPFADMNSSKNPKRKMVAHVLIPKTTFFRWVQGFTLLRIISGARYSGVPHNVQVRPFTLLAKPKSVTWRQKHSRVKSWHWLLFYLHSPAVSACCLYVVYLLRLHWAKQRWMCCPLWFAFYFRK